MFCLFSKKKINSSIALRFSSSLNSDISLDWKHHRLRSWPNSFVFAFTPQSEIVFKSLLYNVLLGGGFPMFHNSMVNSVHSLSINDSISFIILYLAFKSLSVLVTNEHVELFVFVQFSSVNEIDLFLWTWLTVIEVYYSFGTSFLIYWDDTGYSSSCVSSSDISVSFTTFSFLTVALLLSRDIWSFLSFAISPLVLFHCLHLPVVHRFYFVQWFHSYLCSMGLHIKQIQCYNHQPRFMACLGCLDRCHFLRIPLGDR